MLTFKPMRRMDKVRRIIVHHSSSDTGSARQFHDWHLARGWAGVGYHYVIGNGDGAGDGEIQIGRLALYQGAHCRGHNDDSIGICLVGSFVSRYPSEAQMKALIELLATLCHIYKLDPLSGLHISGHKDWNDTDCPGKKLYRLQPRVREQVADKLCPPSNKPSSSACLSSPPSPT